MCYSRQIIFSLVCICSSLFSMENTNQYTTRDVSFKIKPLYVPKVPQEVHDRIDVELLSLEAEYQAYLDDLEKFKNNGSGDGKPTLSPQENINQTNKTFKAPLPNIPEWILKSSLDNAPELLQGVFYYLWLRQHYLNMSLSLTNIPSFHRFILVGPSGTGKTTLAYAIAYKLKCLMILISATGLLSKFKNETALTIQKELRGHACDGLRKLIVIDDVHKLFEHYADHHYDHDQNVAAFCFALDEIERCYPNCIIICTASSVEKFPSELKSRFSGRIFATSLLDKNQRIQMFKDSIANDQSVELDSSVDDVFIATMLQSIQKCSFRDVQLIVDMAKIISCSEQCIGDFIFLKRDHFNQAFNHLKVEWQHNKKGPQRSIIKK